MKVRIKKLNPEAKIPIYAKEGDAAMDVYAISKNQGNGFIEYGTGLAFEIPENYVLLIFPRSSVSNKNLSQCNSVGVVDSGYRGELKIRFYKMSEEEYEIGERIAQIMILPYPKIHFEEADKLSETSRGDGAFGSTGK